MPCHSAFQRQLHLVHPLLTRGPIIPSRQPSRQSQIWVHPTFPPPALRPVSSLLSSLQPTGANLSCVRLGDNVRVSKTMHDQLTDRESSRGPRCCQDIGNGSHCAGSNQEQLSSSISRVSSFFFFFFFSPSMGRAIFFPI